MREQTRHVLESIKAVLAREGGSMDDVVRVRVYVTQLDQQSLREIHEVGRHRPVKTSAKGRKGARQVARRLRTTSVMMTAMRIGGFIGLLLLAASPALAQPLIPLERTPEPQPQRPSEPFVVPPGNHFQMTRPTDADHYPIPPRVNYDLAFITPLSTKTETPTSTGRMGFAGWVSPATPVGAEQTLARWDIGWFALGFAIEWGGPPPAAPAKRPPAR